MTDKEQDAQEQNPQTAEVKTSGPKKAVRKVSTGAWWKSTSKATPKTTEFVAKEPKLADLADSAEAEALQSPEATVTPGMTAEEPAAQVSFVEISNEKTVATSSPAEALVSEAASDPVPEHTPEPVDAVELALTETGTVADETVNAAIIPAPADMVEAAETDQAETTEGEPAPRRRRSRRGGRRHKPREEADTAALESSALETPTPELALPASDGHEGDDDLIADDDDLVADEPDRPPEKPVSYKLLINADEPEECRIALLENNRLESYHATTTDREPTKNNIYKGRILSVEANLQAAFVDIGTGRNGFLPFNEIHPEYYREDLSDKSRELISQQQWKKLKIEEVMQRGQEVLVQVVKEVTGNKGANMTTFLSLPGRCLVLMPGSDSAGISRKIVGEERRAGLREIMSEFDIPEGIGYIIRTASAEITKAVLEKDLQTLLGLWEEIKERGQTLPSPALIYEEQDTVIRFLRDHFFPEIQEIQVDTKESLTNVKAFIEQLPTKQQQVKVLLHRGSKPIFNQYNIEEQIESIYRPRVELPSGGSIVIDPTEALVAIDVNSGRTSKNSDFEETIFLANMEAAAELARQLRLRDLGGLIVVDFIDMRNKKHIREVERQVKISMKRDKAKSDISRISRFGLMQISRQKMGAPIEKGSYRTCEHCQGRGVVRSVETQALQYLRRIQTGVTRKKVVRIECHLPLETAQYLLNKKRAELVELENKHNTKVEIIPQTDMLPAESRIDYFDAEVTRN